MRTLSLQPKRGFTLIELMFASTLSVMVLGAVLAGFTQQRKIFHQKNLEQELQQNVRTAMLFLQRDLRYSGSGLTMGFLNLDMWFGLDAGITTIPWITDEGGGKDAMILVGISGEPVASLASWVYEGDNQLTLDIIDSTILPYEPRAGDVLLIAGIEAVVVSNVNSTTVTVSRDPRMIDTGVHLNYPEDVQVFLLNVIQYWVDDVEGVTSLLRDDSRFIYESNEDRVIADGIETFDLTRTGDLVEITLTGRSRRTVPNLANDDKGDSLLRYTLSSSNRIRNTNPKLSIHGWPSDVLYADPSAPDDDGSTDDGGADDGGTEDDGGADDGGTEDDGGTDDTHPGGGNSGNRPSKGKNK